MDLTITEASNPNPLRNPAHSNETSSKKVKEWSVRSDQNTRKDGQRIILNITTNIIINITNIIIYVIDIIVNI